MRQSLPNCRKRKRFAYARAILAQAPRKTASAEFGWASDQKNGFCS